MASESDLVKAEDCLEESEVDRLLAIMDTNNSVQFGGQRFMVTMSGAKEEAAITFFASPYLVGTDYSSFSFYVDVLSPEEGGGYVIRDFKGTGVVSTIADLKVFLEQWERI